MKPGPHFVAQSTRLKRAFLAAFAQCGNVSQACRMAGVGSRSTIRYWQEHDEAFLMGFRQAEVTATERLESEAWRRAVEGSPYERTSYYRGEVVGTDRKIEYSDTLLLALLRARAPERYRDKVDVTVTQTIKAIGGVEPADVL